MKRSGQDCFSPVDQTTEGGRKKVQALVYILSPLKQNSPASRGASQDLFFGIEPKKVFFPFSPRPNEPKNAASHLYFKQKQEIFFPGEKPATATQSALGAVSNPTPRSFSPQMKLMEKEEGSIA